MGDATFRLRSLSGELGKTRTAAYPRRSFVPRSDDRRTTAFGADVRFQNGFT
jgi:hypothetical protein